jgi:hypothetical protein
VDTKRKEKKKQKKKRKVVIVIVVLYILVIHITCPTDRVYHNDASAGNLFNKEQFPAAPFRTDKWEGITVKNKYTVGK